MFVLGLLLILLAVGVSLAAVMGTSDQLVTFDLNAFTVQMNPLGVFLTGAATVLVLVIGLGLARAGMRSARKRREEKRELRRLNKKVAAQERGEGTHTAPTATTGTTPTTTADGTDTVTDRERPTH